MKEDKKFSKTVPKIRMKREKKKQEFKIDIIWICRVKKKIVQKDVLYYCFMFHYLSKIAVDQWVREAVKVSNKKKRSAWEKAY